jgi:undecaprenyl-diphosphatase
MIIASSFFGIASDDFTNFTIVIQLGAILSVVVLYFKRFFQTWDFYFKHLLYSCGSLGLLFSDLIDELLESLSRCRFSFTWWYRFIKVDGGLIIRRILSHLSKTQNWVIPMPRNGSGFEWRKHCGGMSQLARTSAAEFSFFLAVPTMFGATAKKCYDITKMVLS